MLIGTQAFQRAHTTISQTLLTTAAVLRLFSSAPTTTLTDGNRARKQLECRLPWPISVALPPRSMDKYSRTLGLLLKLEFTNHVLEEAHVLHR